MSTLIVDANPSYVGDAKMRKNILAASIACVVFVLIFGNGLYAQPNN